MSDPNAVSSSASGGHTGSGRSGSGSFRCRNKRRGCVRSAGCACAAQRVDAHAYRNFLAAVRTIAKTEGVAGFYKGLFPSLVKSAPASAVTFAVFEALMRMSVKEDDDDA